MADKGLALSNYGTKPTEITKSDVPRLNKEALRKLEFQIKIQGDPEVDKDFDFPCNDDSRGVQDFSAWTYFKRPQFHEPPKNMKHSFLWSPELLAKIRDQRNYQQFVPEKTLTGYRETNQNLERKKRAKRMLAIWKKSPSTIRRMDGSDASASIVSTGDLKHQAKSGNKRSVSPPKTQQDKLKDIK